MSKIVELMLQKKPFVFSGEITEEQIKDAEEKLGVRFAEDYREYVAVFGTASYYGHELTGICTSDSSVNVIDVTVAEREFISNIPNGWYVIEQTHVDGIVIWQDEKGRVYRASFGKWDKIFDSLVEYVSAG